MAFCPNCGAPTTEQAEKCVSCGHQLSSQQKAKFKGTIMMSPVQAAAAPKPAPVPAAPNAALPAAPPPPVGAPAAAAAPASSKPFAKTMLGSAVASPLAAYDRPDVEGPASPDGDGDLGSAATMHGSAVPYARTVEATPVSAPTPAAREAPSTGPVGSPRGAPEFAPSPVGVRSLEPAVPAQAPRMPSQFGLAAGGEEGEPAPHAASSGRALLFGLGGALAVAVLGGGALFALGGTKLLGGSSAEVAQAWKQSVGQAVTQVAQLCTQDCNAAGVYFHPQTQAALLGQAKLLTPARAARLAAAESTAHMLADTDAAAVATNLGLDAARCVQLVLGAAQAVGCSVNDGQGSESLRLVHLAGIDTL